MFERVYYKVIRERLEEPRRFIQIVTGPRQVGKTTMVKQVLSSLKTPRLMYSADDVPTSKREWISDCWENARMKLRTDPIDSIVLVIDEVQKIAGWSEVVKKCGMKTRSMTPPSRCFYLARQECCSNEGWPIRWQGGLRQSAYRTGPTKRCTRHSVLRWNSMFIWRIPRSGRTDSG